MPSHAPRLGRPGSGNSREHADEATEVAAQRSWAHRLCSGIWELSGVACMLWSAADNSAEDDAEDHTPQLGTPESTFCLRITAANDTSKNA
eukprot:scaffold105083_cov17-Tisochrysis_lutea.AAC.1